MEVASLQDSSKDTICYQSESVFECASLGFYSSSYNHFHQNLRQDKEAVSFKVQTAENISVRTA